MLRKQVVHAVSATMGYALADGEKILPTVSGGNLYPDTYYSRIVFPGSKSANVKAVRIYNRLLTEAEMRRNQRVDMKRFNIVFALKPTTSRRGYGILRRR